MTRGATLFSGGGGVEALLKKRIQFVHAVEYDPAIAAVYRRNHGDHIQVADVCDVDYTTWGALDYLHASPVCKEYSQAKTGGVEGDTDINTALAVVRCIEQTTPRVFTLENVGAYQHGKAYRLICAELSRLGYMWHAEVLNSANFGVPQTRRRLILRAVKDALLPGLAAPDPWVGWFESIEDLIATLPPSQFAAWQLARLPEAISGGLLIGKQYAGPNTNADRLVQHSHPHEPTFSIVASGGGDMRAFIVAGNGNQLGMPDRGSVTNRDAAAPYFTITASCEKVPSRAWLVAPSGQNGDLLSAEHEPSHTITTAHLASKHRAWLAAGRVVRMTARALARFQSFPDDYILPEKSSLACQIIGNAVPSLMMQKIVEPLL